VHAVSVTEFRRQRDVDELGDQPKQPNISSLPSCEKRMGQVLMTLTALAFRVVLRQNHKVIVSSSATTKSRFVGAEVNLKTLGRGKGNSRVARKGLFCSAMSSS